MAWQGEEPGTEPRLGHLVERVRDLGDLRKARPRAYPKWARGGFASEAFHCAWQRVAIGKSRSVKFRYREAMLATYPEIRDRIYVLALKHAFRVDWRETTRNSRLLLLHDSRQIVVARARVPMRHMDPDVLAELAYQLEDVFGEGWMG